VGWGGGGGGGWGLGVGGGREQDNAYETADVLKNALPCRSTPFYPKVQYKLTTANSSSSPTHHPERLRSVVPSRSSVGDTVTTSFIRRPRFAGFGDYNRDRPGDPGAFTDKDGTVQYGRLRALHVSGLQLADRRRPRDLGFPRTRQSEGSVHEKRDALCTLPRSASVLSSPHHGYKPRTRPAPLLKATCPAQLHDQNQPHVDCRRPATVRYTSGRER